MPALLLSLLLAPLVSGAPAHAGRAHAASQDVGAAFAENGIRVDRERGLCSVSSSVLITEELLEYLLVAPHGAAHESLLVTEADPAVLNTALLLLGVTPGTNARTEPVEPPPTPEERAAGAEPVRAIPPEGDGFYLYVAWRDGEEVHLHRLEDLVVNLETGRAMRRHRFVYLGSRFVREASDAPEIFVATQAGNLVNVSFFFAGDTLLTAALPECLSQTIWLANSWLLPERDRPVELVFARERIRALPPAWEAALPDVGREGGAEAAGGGER